MHAVTIITLTPLAATGTTYSQTTQTQTQLVVHNEDYNSNGDLLKFVQQYSPVYVEERSMLLLYVCLTVLDVWPSESLPCQTVC